MPVHRVPTADGITEGVVRTIEKDHRIIAVVPSGDGAVLIFTEPKQGRPAKARETR